MLASQILKFFIANFLIAVVRTVTEEEAMRMPDLLIDKFQSLAQPT
jgi:hypothetical protein